MANNLSNVGSSVKKIGTYWNKPPKGRFLPFKEWASYSAGGMGVNFVINFMYIFINAEFIPQMYKIPAMHGRYMTIAVVALNLLIQPIFGSILDNTHTKKGKFKPFLAVMTPIAGLVTVLAAWNPQIASESSRIIYAYLTCVPCLMVLPLWLQVYNMVPAAMTPDTQERTDLLAPVGLISSFAPTILNVIVWPVRELFIKQGKEYLAYRIQGIVCVVVGVLMAYLIVLFTKERVYVTPEQTEKIKFIDGIRQVLKNKPFMVFQLANVFGVLKLIINAQMVFIATYKYADTYGRGTSIMAGLSLITGFGATPAMLLVPLLSRKFSKRNILIFSQIMAVVPCTIAMIIGFDKLPIGGFTIVLMTISGFLVSFNAGVGIVASPAITAEQYDYQQYKTGQRLEGFMSTVGAYTAGLGGSLLALIPTWIQTKIIGFEPGNDIFTSNAAYLPQNAAITNRWFNVACLISLVTSIIWSGILLLGYKLDEKEHRRIIAIIKERSIGNTIDSDDAFEIIGKGEIKERNKD